MGGLLKLAENSNDILTYFASSEKPASGFSEQQVTEEQLKADLILTHNAWRPLIDRAEGHGYFRGQIEFLLDFSGIIAATASTSVAEWDGSEHLKLQGLYGDYLQKAEVMFTSRGLKDLPGFRWERALLCVGDYLLPRGRNYSFDVEYRSGNYKIFIQADQITPFPEFVTLLQDSLDSENKITRYIKSTAPELIENTIIELREKLVAA